MRRLAATTHSDNSYLIKSWAAFGQQHSATGRCTWLVRCLRSTRVGRQHASNGNAFGNSVFVAVAAAEKAVAARTFVEQYEIWKVRRQLDTAPHTEMQECSDTDGQRQQQQQRSIVTRPTHYAIHWPCRRAACHLNSSNVYHRHSDIHVSAQSEFSNKLYASVGNVVRRRAAVLVWSKSGRSNDNTEYCIVTSSSACLNLSSKSAGRWSVTRTVRQK